MKNIIKFMREIIIDVSQGKTVMIAGIVWHMTHITVLCTDFIQAAININYIRKYRDT